MFLRVYLVNLVLKCDDVSIYEEFEICLARFNCGFLIDSDARFCVESFVYVQNKSQ